MEQIKRLILLLWIVKNVCAINDTLCCPENEELVYDAVRHKCVNRRLNRTTLMSLDCKNFVIKNNDVFQFSLINENQLNVSRPGMLYEPDPYDVGTFCLSTVVVSGNYTWDPDPATIPVAVICIFGEWTTDPIILARCMFVSVVFLTITAIIYCAMPELRDLQGKSIISLCLSLALGLLVFGILGITEVSTASMCATAGFFAYFLMMASFFWMNAISIQIFRSVRKAIMPDYGRREFGWYSLYAWGCPAILTMIVIVANYVPGKHLVPGIGLDRCWFFRNKEQWAYMYSIIAILLFVNISIFVYCSVLLWRHKFSSTNIKALRYKFCMSLELMFVMGITWIFDLASAAHGKYHVVWVIMDIINTLQGVFFFVILVLLRKRTIKALHRRGWLCCLNDLAERYLAKTDDAEENVIQHTTVLSFDDR